MKNIIKILTLTILALFSVTVLKAQPKPKTVAANNALEVKTKVSAEKASNKPQDRATTLSQQNPKVVPQQQGTAQRITISTL